MALQGWRQREDELQSQINDLKIAQHASPYIPQERPREGVGGTNEHPFDDFGNDRNTPVINPATGKPEWAGTSQGLKIASGPDYIGDKLRYGQLDRILNPFGDFSKPNLDQLRIHNKAYQKVKV